eukprot:954812-Prorocentrum_minimum.AAC.2
MKSSGLLGLREKSGGVEFSSGERCAVIPERCEIEERRRALRNGGGKGEKGEKGHGNAVKEFVKCAPTPPQNGCL